MEDHPGVTRSSKETETGASFGGIWHRDMRYLPKPPTEYILLAREVSSVHADTMWSDQFAAYETFFPALEGILGRSNYVQSTAGTDASKTREDRVKDSGRGMGNLQVLYPDVRTHLQTGRKALLERGTHDESRGTEDKSMPRLKILFKHQVKMDFKRHLGEYSIAKHIAGDVPWWNDSHSNQTGCPDV